MDQLKRFAWKIIRSISFHVGLKKKIMGSKNVLRVSDVLFRKSRVVVMGSDNIISIASKSRIENQLILIIGNGNYIRLGEKCILKGEKIQIEGTGCQVAIGDGTTIESAEIACTENGTKILIGKDCMLAFDVDIRNGDSHSIIDVKTGKRLNYARNIEIEDHVWLAAHVTILKGVKIGSGAIVASGSVVTKNVNDNSIFAGVPAKQVKTGIKWLRERIER